MPDTKLHITFKIERLIVFTSEFEGSQKTQVARPQFAFMNGKLSFIAQRQTPATEGIQQAPAKEA